MRIKRLLTCILIAVLMLAAYAPALAEYSIRVTQEADREMDRYSTLKRGSKGTAVRNLQNRLVTLGYLAPGDVDGSYGRVTEDAVYAFQTANWLTGSNGTAYPYTQYKLFDSTAVPAWGLTLYDLGSGMRGDDVLRLEKRLCDTGYLEDAYVDGYYDYHTETAVYLFQMQNPTECLDGIACIDTQQVLYSYNMTSGNYVR